jgi:3-oxoacyl-[acyl-carrier-protein] synthase-3
MTSFPRPAAVIGAGHYVPEKILSNADLEKIVDTSDEWIRTRTGIRERRIAAEGESTCDMAVRAARAALDSARVAPGEVDAIVFATGTPDYFNIPSSACILQHALGIPHAYGYDLAAACSGFVYALDAGATAIAVGRADTVLVVGAEKLSAFTDYTDRNTCVLFGDGAGAVVLRASETPGVLSTVLGIDGDKSALISLPGGGSRNPPSQKVLEERLCYWHMQGRELFKVAVHTLTQGAQDALAKANLSLDDIDVIIPHQANARIIEAVCDRLGGEKAREKLFLDIESFGNTSAASIAIALSDAVSQGRVRPGDKVLLTAFGGGLTWGAAVLVWDGRGGAA